MEENGQINWVPISRGDKQAFEVVFRTYYGLLCRYAKSMVIDRDEAEEVVQNTFYNLWKRRETIEIKGSVKAYLYKAVHNESLNKIKHKKVRQEYAADYKHNMEKVYEDSGKLVLAKELREKIERAMASLPEQCGKVFKLSRLEELKYQEIAEHLNISVKTVEIHMSKALKLMREQLKDYLPGLIISISYFFHLLISHGTGTY